MDLLKYITDETLACLDNVKKETINKIKQICKLNDNELKIILEKLKSSDFE